MLIGDSISIAYTQPVRELLKGKANLHRIPTNGGHSKSGTTLIEKWLGTGKWDAIHFNRGHPRFEIHARRQTAGGGRGLREKSPRCRDVDEDQRREADELQSAKDVHFKAEGSAFLAKQVAASIEAALAVEKCSSVRTVVATE